MRRSKLIRLFLMWVCGLLLLTGIAHADELTIDEAIRMALKNNEAYLSALQDKRKAEGQIKEAWAGALPSLTFNGGYTRNFELQTFVFGGDQIQIGGKNDYSLRFDLQQTLFGGGRVFNALAIARLYNKAASQAVQAARQALIFNTRNLFYSAILAHDYVQVSQDAVERARENLDVVTSLYDQGLISEFDRLRAEVELANLKPQLTKSKNIASIALSNLRYFIGYESRREVELNFDFDLVDTITTPELEAALDTAFRQRPDYVQQDYLIKAYKKAIGISRSGRMPSLYFSAALEWAATVDETFPGDGDWNRSTSASLSLNFPIFDGLESSGKVKQSKADYVKSKLAKSQIEDAIRLEVEEAISSIEESKLRLVTSQKTIALAEEGLRVANLRFKNGIGTQLEILSAQEALTTARTNHIEAIYDYEIALAKYEKAVGFDRWGKRSRK